MTLTCSRPDSTVISASIIPNDSIHKADNITNTIQKSNISENIKHRNNKYAELNFAEPKRGRIELFN